MERLKLLISWLLILAGAVEAVWGLLQVYGYVASNHSLYALTGSFYNPGPYSGFLAMCVPVSLHEWLKGRRVWKHLALAALVLMVVVLPSGMSRSAWLAGALASGYVLSVHHREKLYRYWKASLAGVLLLIVLGIGAYHWKKDSADGRLLIWKVASQVIVPWTGVGWENVAGAYGKAQERYFYLGKGTEQEKHVAGAPEYVFNEYLQVGIAWGVPVLFVILTVVIVLFSWGDIGTGSTVSAAVCSRWLSLPFRPIRSSSWSSSWLSWPCWCAVRWGTGRCGYGGQRWCWVSV